MSDLISRQAAIDAMNTWDWQDLYLPIHFKQLLEDVPSAQQWIPCSERLPLFGQWVLVTDGRSVDIGIFSSERIDKMGNYEYSLTTIQLGEIDVALAWMSLPEPWKGGEE